MLARPELEQLAQRVIARYHLQALGEAETTQYVRHRLEVCGLERPLPFDRRALRRVHVASGGVPRRINLLCDRALLGAYANGQGVVTRAIVNEAAAEVFPRPGRSFAGWPRAVLAGVLGLVAGAGLLAAVTRVGMPMPFRSAGLHTATAAPAPTLLVRAPRRAPAPKLLYDQEEAWRELAEVWKQPVQTHDPCGELEDRQVRCFRKKLDLATIRQLGRPGILTLDAASGKPAYAILAALGEHTATLRAAGTEQTVTLAALAQRWEGEFSTLWKAPADYHDRPRDGSGGPAIDWIAAQLATLKGQPAPRKAVLDPALKGEVRAFQLAQGLNADGRPGPLTYMQLNRASGVEEPRLRTEP
jgi:general secretion pathway protein A